MHVHSPDEHVIARRRKADQNNGCGSGDSRGADRPRSFSLPYEVLDDPSLNRSQKRAILAEWASDACAVASFPALRRLPGTALPVTLSSIMDALSLLDDRCKTEDLDTAPGAVRIPVGLHSRSRRSHAGAPHPIA